MSKKAIFIPILLLGFAALSFGGYQVYKFSNEIKDLATPIAELNARKDKENAGKEVKEPSTFSKDKPFNILLLGIDRRSKAETGYRTDIMIMMSVYQAKKKIVLTSVPRDLWVNGSRINAIMVGSGWEGMQSAFENITGMKADAYIQCDFEDLVWIVDSFGGLEVELDNAFTDSEYPNDATKTYMTVSFNQGKQTISGREALILSRSRHGNNGEGSDFSRMKRQHKILKAMPNAVLSAKSIFNPMNVAKSYEMITQRMITNLTLGDAQLLWEYYPERDQYTIESFFVDSNYLYNPPMSEYGGAWVLVAKNNDYTPIHTAIKEKLGMIEPKPAQTDNATSVN